MRSLVAWNGFGSAGNEVARGGMLDEMLRDPRTSGVMCAAERRMRGMPGFERSIL